jgi:hypothetical protein
MVGAFPEEMRDSNASVLTAVYLLVFSSVSGKALDCYHCCDDDGDEEDEEGD